MRSTFTITGKFNVKHLIGGLFMPKWESYEEVGTYLLNQFAVKFGLDRVEAKKTFMAIDLEHLGKSMQGVFVKVSMVL